MTFLCLGLAFGLTLLLGFVSHIQLLYLESIRIIRRETQSLQFFRETLAGQIGLELGPGLGWHLVEAGVGLPVDDVRRALPSERAGRG